MEPYAGAHPAPSFEDAASAIGSFPGADLMRMVDVEMSRVAHGSGPIGMTPIEEAEALTLLMVKQFAP